MKKQDIIERIVKNHNDTMTTLSGADIDRVMALCKCAEHITKAPDFAFEATTESERLNNGSTVSLKFETPAVISNLNTIDWLSDMIAISDAVSFVQDNSSLTINFQIVSDGERDEK